MRWRDALERLIAWPGVAAGTAGAADDGISDARGLWNAGQGISLKSKNRRNPAWQALGRDYADFSVDISLDAGLEAQSERNGHRKIG
jgi:hypothetical protein